MPKEHEVHTTNLAAKLYIGDFGAKNYNVVYSSLRRK